MDYDVIISGAGPAGVACALSLAGSGLKIAVLDKGIFPRDKICGDALSIDVINQLPLLSADVAKVFSLAPDKLASSGVRIFSPDHTAIDIPFIHHGQPGFGYTMPRKAFDHLLFQQLKTLGCTTVLENCALEGAILHPERVQLQTTRGTMTCSMLIGADGAHSITRKLLTNDGTDRHHYSGGLRVYYEGIDRFHQDHYIELYFLKDILPGYLWIFPLQGGRANVGMGVLGADISRKKINLKKSLHEYLATHPLFKERFKRATPLETVKGFGLPLGSRRRKLSGHRVLLTGDAAGLIDPFTGEGIGNALRSGRLAATHIKRCFAALNFSQTFNVQYDADVYAKMWPELKVSYNMQRLCRYASLFNFIAHKAHKSAYWHNFLTEAMADVHQKKSFTDPAFYWRLLFH